jgi:ribonuclease HI
VLTSYTDGACRVSNPGICSCAFVLYGLPGGEYSQVKYLGPELHTNNYAEYQGLILLLEWLYAQSIRNVVIHCDSKLVVNQTLHNWECNGDLRPLMSKAYGLLVQGCHALKHIKGHEGNKGNERADELCNAMLDIHKEEYEKLAKV